MERKLAAILSADFADFSRHVAAAEELTVRAVRGHLDALELVIGLHRGRVVKTMGDGVLVELPSAVDAVTCAAAMQDRMQERNADQPEARRMDLRIGVHAGEILFEDGDIFGDDVNIAARIEPLAPPGGVMVSAPVFDAASTRTDLRFSDLGLRQLKNIARPIRLYRLDRAAGLALVGHAPQPLPDKPSLAVLPLVNLSAQAENEYLADGLTEDIITALAQVPWLFVIARNSSFTYKGAATDVRRVGRDLGVRYVFEGSVRSQGNRLRVTGQLADAETGAQIWAQRFDGADEDLFELQDRVTGAIAAAIAPTVQTAEITRAVRSQPGSLTAYDHYLRALAALNRAFASEAARHLDAALDADPDYAKAMAIRAWCLTLQVAWTMDQEFEDGAARSTMLAHRALELDGNDLEVAAYAGYVLGFFCGDIDRGMDLLRQVTQKCPSFAWAWTSLGLLENVHGDPAQALDHIDIAQRLNPRDPLFFRSSSVRASALACLGRWEESLQSATSAIRQNPTPIVTYLTAAAAALKLGRADEARAIIQALMLKHPKFSLDQWLQHGSRFRNREHHTLIKSLLGATGLIE